MAWQLSDNGYKAVVEIGRWVMAAIAVLAIRAQDAKKVDAIKEQTEAIKAALERKPLVFGEKPE